MPNLLHDAQQTRYGQLVNVMLQYHNTAATRPGLNSVKVT